jgi:hypothetical protein
VFHVAPAPCYLILGRRSALGTLREIGTGTPDLAGHAVVRFNLVLACDANFRHGRARTSCGGFTPDVRTFRANSDA